jgi:DNA repair exonuclease SbcCD nuclease subunit
MMKNDINSERYIAFITDTHAGVRNDSEIFAAYQKKFYDEVFFPEIKSRNIKTVIHGGDYFERRKIINFRSLELNIEMFVKPLVDNKMQMHMIVGNHDVAYKNTNRLNSPELLLSAYADNIHLYSEPTTLFGNRTDKPIHLVPWINKENIGAAKSFLDNASPSLVIGHFDIMGFSMHKGGITSQHGLDREFFGGHKKILSGHYHTQSEIGNIQYTGNPFEFTWNDYNDKRGFWIIDTHTFEMEFIENPDRMFYKYVYDSDNPEIDDIKDKYVKVVVASKKDPVLYDKWLDDIYAMSPQDIQVIESLDDLGSDMTEEELKQQTKSTTQLMQTYIEGIEQIEPHVKQGVQSLLNELHIEALSES